MAFFNDINNKIKKNKAENELKKVQKSTEILAETNNAREEVERTRQALTEQQQLQNWLDTQLDQAVLNREIRAARQKLFLQRDKVLKRLMRYNGEYHYQLSEPDSPYKEKKLKEYSTEAKNAAYAYAIINNAIERLGRVRSDYEWKQIMRDITSGYKAINAINTGSSLMTRLSFLIQKARAEKKGEISVSAMERYYGKPIDALLNEAKIDGVASQMLVQDNLLDYKDQEKIVDAITRGVVFTADPEDVNKMAQDQSEAAAQMGNPTIFTNPYQVYTTADSLDSLPTNMDD